MISFSDKLFPKTRFLNYNPCTHKILLEPPSLLVHGTFETGLMVSTTPITEYLALKLSLKYMREPASILNELKLDKQEFFH